MLTLPQCAGKIAFRHSAQCPAADRILEYKKEFISSDKPGSSPGLSALLAHGASTGSKYPDGIGWRHDTDHGVEEA